VSENEQEVTKGWRTVVHFATHIFYSTLLFLLIGAPAVALNLRDVGKIHLQGSAGRSAMSKAKRTIWQEIKVAADETPGMYFGTVLDIGRAVSRLTNPQSVKSAVVIHKPVTPKPRSLSASSIRVGRDARLKRKAA
jgi:hypothetical protein